MITLDFHAHCQDRFSYDIHKDGELVDSKEADYVPKFLSRDGDSIRLRIDVETGQIIGWNKDLILTHIKELDEDVT